MLLKTAVISKFCRIPVDLGLFWIGFPHLSQNNPSFGKLGHKINPLTPGAFCQKCIFLDIMVVLRLDLGQISFNQVIMHLQHDSMPFLPLVSCFTTFWLGRAQKSKF